MRFRTYLLIFFAIVFFLTCGDNNSPSNPSEEIKCDLITPTEEKIFELKPENLWMNTGIKLERRWEIVISSDDERSLGDEEIDMTNPIPFFGSAGLIMKVEGMSPQPVGKRYAFVTGIEHQGKYLFIGWNSSKPLKEKVVEMEDGTTKIVYPSSISVKVSIFKPEAENFVLRPSLSAPVDKFWTNNQNPQFYWDSIDNALRYIFEISRFEDFRNLEQVVEVAASGGQVGSPASVIGGSNQQLQITLQEGIYFWRVRSQINIGRPLNPIPLWTCWSYPYRLGIELGTPPSPPTFLSPTTSQFKSGERVTFEFLTDDDPSFVMWRMRHVASSCDEQPSINPNDPTSGNPTPWKIMRTKYGEGTPQSRPKLIATFRSSPLETGNHLFRVEIKDFEDTTGLRVQTADFRLSAGCGGEESQQSTTQPTQGSQQSTTQTTQPTQ